MEFEVTKMGERGQIVVPKGFREDMRLKAGEKFIVIKQGDVLLLKKMEPPNLAETEIMIKKGHDHAKRHSITEIDLQRAIKRARSKR